MSREDEDYSNPEPTFSFNEKSVIIYKLGRIESMLTEVGRQLAAQSLDQTTNETRLRKLENKWAWTQGIAAAVSVFFTFTVNWFYHTKGL